jgi:hypothetical protein
VIWIRGRTIPTERPPLVGEVSANRRCHTPASVVLLLRMFAKNWQSLKVTRYGQESVAPQTLSLLHLTFRTRTSLSTICIPDCIWAWNHSPNLPYSSAMQFLLEAGTVMSVLRRPGFNLTNITSNERHPSNRPWRPIGLWDVKDPTVSR